MALISLLEHDTLDDTSFSLLVSFLRVRTQGTVSVVKRVGVFSVLFRELFRDL